MREFSVEGIKARFAYAGELAANEYDLGELRWRMYQWRRLGLMYFAETLDRLEDRGTIDACFLLNPPEERPDEDEPVPEPFPVPAEAYDHVAALHQWDREAFLSELAYYKRVHECHGVETSFPNGRVHDRYVEFVEQYYESDRPYRGRKVYWILFDREGVAHFSEAYGVERERLEKFRA